MVLALADLLSKELGWNVYVHNVGILVGCVFAISLSAYGLEKALLVAFMRKTLHG